jgi:hypothetical protein
MTTPLDIQLSVDSIVSLVQRSFSSSSTELHDRLQWPLFLAGIETKIAIDRESIFSKLTSERVARALRGTLDAEALAGQRLSMTEIRNLLYNSAEHCIAADIPFFAHLP